MMANFVQDVPYPTDGWKEAFVEVIKAAGEGMIKATNNQVGSRQGKEKDRGPQFLECILSCCSTLLRINSEKERSVDRHPGLGRTLVPCSLRTDMAPDSLCAYSAPLIPRNLLPLRVNKL